MKNGKSTSNQSISESEVVQKIQKFRRRIIEEMGYSHHSPEVKDGLRYALKWFDKILLNRD